MTNAFFVPYTISKIEYEDLGDFGPLDLPGVTPSGASLVEQMVNGCGCTVSVGQVITEVSGNTEPYDMLAAAVGETIILPIVSQVRNNTVEATGFMWVKILSVGGSHSQWSATLEDLPPLFTCASQVPPPDDKSVPVTDTCGGPVTVTHDPDVISTQSCPSAYTINRTYLATDSCGNSGSITEVITVSNTTPLMISCPATVTTDTDTGQSFASGVQLGSPPAVDGCGGSVTLTNNAPTQFPLGTNLVVWTATDPCGNSASCTQNVIVLEWDYTTNNSMVVITAYTGPGGAATVPATINGLLVTGIGDYAFYNNTSLSSILIPASVTCFGGESFYGCATNLTVTIYASGTNTVFAPSDNCDYSLYDLTSLVISNGVTGIGDGAFIFDTTLTSLLIPASVTCLGVDSFYGCATNLTVTIYAGGTNTVFAPPDNCNYGLYDLTSLVISNGVTGIGEAAFYDNTSLTSLLIPASVTCFGEDAFYGCATNLTVTIYASGTNTVFAPSDNCNYGLYNLTSLVISNGVTGIGEAAFYDNTSLTSLLIPAGVTCFGRMHSMAAPPT